MADDLHSRGLVLIIVEVSFLIALDALSLIGNTLVCIAVYRNTQLRTTTNLYIVALAVSDLLSAVFVMPLGVGVLVAGRWIFGQAVCQLHAFFSLFVLYVSPVTMGLTALNRFARVCKTREQYNRVFAARKSRILLASIWIFVACFLLVPRLCGIQGFEFVPGYAQCSVAHQSETGKIINYCLVLTLFLVIPLIATVFSYTRVAKTIHQHNTSGVLTIQRQETHVRLNVHEIRLSKSLFAVVFAFMFSWIPLWIIVIMWRFRLVPSMPRNIELLCMFFLYFSNTINPFIYAGMNPLFRKELRSILCCKSSPRVAAVSNRDDARTEEIGLGKLPSCPRPPQQTGDECNIMRTPREDYQMDEKNLGAN